jgi:NAD(P)-dependent dehydrogenase (short-subunit alcohol dehydrogenase family)
MPMLCSLRRTWRIENHVKALIAEVAEKFGRVHVLCNNAGLELYHRRGRAKEGIWARKQIDDIVPLLNRRVAHVNTCGVFRDFSITGESDEEKPGTSIFTPGVSSTCYCCHWLDRLSS